MRMTNLGSSGPDERGLSIKLRLVESSIGVVELRHLHGHAYLLDGLFKVPPDLRIFILVFNQCSTLASAGANAFLVDRAPTAEKIFSGLPAIPERQLARRLFAGIKVLMEPAAGGTQYAAFTPIDSEPPDRRSRNDTVSNPPPAATSRYSLVNGESAKSRRPDENELCDTAPQATRRYVRPSVLPPMSKDVISHAKAFGFRRVDQSTARIGDEIRFPIDKTTDSLRSVLGTK